MDKIICGKCQSLNSGDATFCNRCGEQLERDEHNDLKKDGTPITTTKPSYNKHLPWKWIIGVTLGAIIAVSTVYIAISTYQSQHALPAYYSQMAGTYGITKDGKELSTKPKLMLDNDGTYGINMDLRSEGKWNLMTGSAGSWYMRGSSIVLDGTEYAGVQTELQIKGGRLYSSEHGLYFTKQ